MIESRFAASRAQENNGLDEEQKHNETTPTKHNRRASHDDDDNDSNYNTDDDLMIHPNDESNLAPDISIVKKEQDQPTESRNSISHNLSADIVPLIQPKTEKLQENVRNQEEESGGTINSVEEEEEEE